MTVIESWVSVEEIALHLGVSKETIYRWLDTGKIPAHRVGKLWKFKPTEVDKWIVGGGADKRSPQTSPLAPKHKIKTESKHE